MNPLRNALVALAALIPLMASNMAMGQEQAPVNQEPTADFSIVNGELADDRAVPGYIQMGIQFPGESDGLHNCGASIVNKEWVLTAAHCVWNPITLEEEGRIEAIPPQIVRMHHPVSGQVSGAASIIIHPEMRVNRFSGNLNWQADIALIKLDTPLQTDARMAIAAPNMVTLRKGHAVVWGRGATKVGQSDERPYQMIPTRKATVPINEPAFCGSSVGMDTMLCAEAPSPAGLSPASCSGDSGGPLTIFSDTPQTMIQVGLVSNAENVPGMPFCGGQPTWYTNVSRYANWIKDYAKDVTFASFTTSGPNGPAQPINPAPAPAPAPPAALQCGNVNDGGSSAPTAFNPSLRWRPMRGEGRGSDVSVAASRLAFSSTDNPPFALLAGECAWADALAATSLVEHGPLLLTNPKQLEPSVVQELQRLKIKEVKIIGGPVAVSPEVESALKQSGIRTSRFLGQSRIQTAALVADYAAKEYKTDRFTLVRGYPAPGGSPSQAFADSMAGAYFAPWTGSPIMLSASDALSDEARNLIKSHKPTRVTLFGGRAALSDKVGQDVVSTLPLVSMRRIAGASRADTAYQAGMEMLRLPSPETAKGVMVIEGQADDAWKVGFTFAPLAAKKQYVYALASGDELAPQSVDLIKQARYLNLPVSCVASDKVCALVDSIRNG